MLLLDEENAREVRLIRVISLPPPTAVMVSASLAVVCEGTVIVKSIKAFPLNTQFVLGGGDAGLRGAPLFTSTSAAKAPDENSQKHAARQAVSENGAALHQFLTIVVPAAGSSVGSIAADTSLRVGLRRGSRGFGKRVLSMRFSYQIIHV